MAAFFAFLTRLLPYIKTFFLVRGLAALGMGFYTYGWITNFVNEIIHHIQTQFSGISANLIAILQISGMGTALSIIISCFTSIAVLKSTKIVFSPLIG